MNILRIDRSTIKKNKNAGNIHTDYLKGYELCLEYEIYQNGICISNKLEATVGKDFQFDKFYQDMKPVIENCHKATIKVDEISQRISHAPIPEFSFIYNYFNSDYVCGRCGKEYFFCDLEEDCWDDEVCPFCGEYAEYETESIYDILEN